MGSSGSGSFSDYEGYRSSDSSAKNEQGGYSGTDICSLAFSTTVDEVSRCEFYRQKKNLPAINTRVIIVFNTRLEVQTEDGLCVGYLPTKYNYLRACMTDGYNYEGVINVSNISPLPHLEVDIAPVS